MTRQQIGDPMAQVPDPLQVIVSNNNDNVVEEEIEGTDSLPQLDAVANNNANNNNDNTISPPPQLEQIAVNNNDSIVAPTQLDPNNPIKNNTDNMVSATAFEVNREVSTTTEETNEIPVAAIIQKCIFQMFITSTDPGITKITLSRFVRVERRCILVGGTLIN